MAAENTHLSTSRAHLEEALFMQYNQETMQSSPTVLAYSMFGSQATAEFL